MFVTKQLDNCTTGPSSFDNKECFFRGMKLIISVLFKLTTLILTVELYTENRCSYKRI